MKSWPLIFVLPLFGSCTSTGVEAGLAVTLELDPGLSSKCVQLVARVGSTEHRSGAVVLKGESTALVAVAQGDFPDVVTLQAYGFSDDTCRTLTVPAEDSLSTEAHFVKNTTTAVSLRVRREVPTGEDCTNGLDDDDDGLIDCLDPDCDAKACSSGNACLVSQTCVGLACVGGSVKACTSPPTGCFAASGNCEAPGGSCAYAPRVNAVCDDADPCTVSDKCSATGVCTGSPKVCNSPPGQCYGAVGTCTADGGSCLYVLVEAQSCSDGNSCTIGDHCSASGQCAGVTVSCAKRECQAFINACDADGGCQYAPLDAGVSCTGGVCNSQGTCNAPFPYVPSNFTEAQIPNVPAAETVLNCGETVIDVSTVPPMVTNWCAGGVPDFGSALIAQAGVQPGVLMAFKALRVGANGSLRFVGPRAPMVVVLGDATLLGPVRTEAGARACAVGAGGSGSSDVLGNGGAGGAGFGSAGGAGAKSLGGTAAGAGGAVNGEPLLVPLRGGCSGGAGGGNTRPNAMGGGALQISVGGVLTVAAAVNAPGNPGFGGFGAAVVVNGGNGGASGGAILLEATSLIMTSAAAVTANGGSGGESSDVAGNSGLTGVEGTMTTLPAPGGATASRIGVGAGGTGGAATATDGGVGAANSGGGGGGVGRIRINTSVGCTIDPAAVVSPASAHQPSDAGCR
jgi:hypothetical protein